jgi:transposase
LRPVTFHTRSVRKRAEALQFGLVAEESPKHSRARDFRQAGHPETVAYHLLATLLLNEYQKTGDRIAALERQSEELAGLSRISTRIAEMVEKLDDASFVVAAQ